MSYNCFICDKLIKGNMFKAYDKNLCSYSCREHLIKKFNFNFNCKLEEKQEMNKGKCIGFMKNIENRQIKTEYISYRKEEEKEGEEEKICINFSGLFNISPVVSKEKINEEKINEEKINEGKINEEKINEEKINEEKNYEKHDKRSCIDINKTSYNNLTFGNIIYKIFEKVKNFSIY